MHFGRLAFNRSLPVVITLLTLGLSAPAQDWKSFSYPPDGFVISMPSQPEFSKRDVPTDQGSFELRTYMVDMSAVAVMVGVCDYGSAVAGRDPQDVLQGAEDGALKNSNSHLVRHQKITLGVYPGLEFEADSNPDPSKPADSQSPTTHFFARIYLVGSTLYQTLAVYPVETPYSGTQRFLDSFQLIPRTSK